MVNEDDDDHKAIIVSAIMLLFFSQAVLAWTYMAQRAPSLYAQRIIWEKILETHRTRTAFKWHLRMSPTSFDRLLSFICPSFELDKRMAFLRGGWSYTT
jgi:hypothetical protein